MPTKPPTIICWQSCTSADTHLPISQNQPTYFVYHLLQKGREMLIPFTKIYLFPGHSSEELEDSLDEILQSQKQSSLDTCTSSAVLIMQRKALALRGGEWDPGLCKLLGFQILANYKNRGKILLSDDADTVYTPNSESLSQPVQLFFKASDSLKKKKRQKKQKNTPKPPNIHRYWQNERHSSLCLFCRGLFTQWLVGQNNCNFKWCHRHCRNDEVFCK